MTSASSSRAAWSSSPAARCRRTPGERAEASFHLVERDFGRFARAVRLTGAFHTARAIGHAGQRRTARPRPEGRGAPRPRHRGPGPARAGRLRRAAAHRLPAPCASCSSATSSAGPGATWCAAGSPCSSTRYGIDLVIANVENAAAGFGITREIGDELLDVRRRRDDLRQSHLGQERGAHVHRRGAAPAAAANLPAGAPGRGAFVARHADGRPVGVDQRDGPGVHAAGRRSVRGGRRARSTGSRASAASSSWTSTPRPRPRRSRWAGTSTAASTAVVGTHTHVQTADERILPGGTAYITDVGMTGPHDSIIGVERAGVLDAVPHGPARADRAGHREPAPAGGRHRRRRAHGPAPATSSASTGRRRQDAGRRAAAQDDDEQPLRSAVRRRRRTARGRPRPPRRRRPAHLHRHRS